MRKRKSVENAVDRSDEGAGNKSEILNQQFKQGDLTWVQIRNSWWPAQVVDEGRLSAKQREKLKNELLVRLYGTYEYMYVDASKSNSEFEDMLKKENKTMKEKFQEALNQDMSLMLRKGQPELESSTSKGNGSADVSKVKKQQSELTQGFTGKETNKIATVLKVCTNKEKTDGSSTQKRKLEFSKKESEGNKTKPRSSEAETPKNKRRKVAKRADPKNYESSIERQFPSVASVAKTPRTNNVVKEAIPKNQEEIKAKDLEIRKIVSDILFGGTINLPKNQSPKSITQGGTSNLEASRKNSQKTTCSRKNMSLKQGDGEIKCKNRKNERVEGSKAVNEVLRTPNLNGSKKSRADETGTPPEVKGTAPPAEEKGLLSERRVRVMQNLALIAPAGSPFRKNGLKI